MMRAAMIAIWCGLAGGASAGSAFDDLTLAAIRGDAPGVLRLLHAGADPNAKGIMGLTPLSAALRSCRSTPEAVAALLAAGADVEARSGIGATPLMLAYQRGRADLAPLLLGAGADPSARNLYGDSAAEYAAFFAGDLPEREFRTLDYALIRTRPGAGAIWESRCDRP